MINKVEICGVNTSKLKVLKESEKIELLKRLRETGDEDARSQLVNGNLRLVLSVVQKFTNRGENLDDLFQVGCIGLIKSIDNFDTSHNVRFSTYAVPMKVIRRNTKKGQSLMTRKTALLKAISYIVQMEQTEETQAVHTKLKEILEELPLNRWSEQTIFDTLEQWAEDNGRNPMVSDLRSKGLPPHPVIKLRFGVNAKEFLDEHFPQDETPKEYWRDFFIDEYERFGRKTAEEYNNLRQEGTPSWATIAKLFDIKRWNDWLDFCGLEPKKSPPPDKRKKPYKRGMKVQIHSHFLDEIERLWSKEKIKEFFPGLTCEVLPSEREDVRDVEEVLEAIMEIRREFAAGDR